MMDRKDLESLMKAPVGPGAATVGQKEGGTPMGRGMTKDYTPEEEAFLAAIEVFKKVNGRRWLNVTDYLWILKKLGYGKKVVSS